MEVVLLVKVFRFVRFYFSRCKIQLWGVRRQLPSPLLAVELRPQMSMWTLAIVHACMMTEAHVSIDFAGLFFFAVKPRRV